MSRSYHMCVSVRGVLINWKDGDLKGMFTDDNGKPMTAAQVKAELLYHLSNGHEVIPACKCDNFDWKKGCMGHEEKSA